MATRDLSDRLNDCVASVAREMTTDTAATWNSAPFSTADEGEGKKISIRTHKGSGKRFISIQDLRTVADMPQLKAARRLNIGATRFKMACKELGWHNWPYRKVKSVRKARQAVASLDEGFHDPAAKDRVKSVLEREEHKILQDPSKALDPDFKRFRQTIYKQDHGKKAEISD